MNKNYIVFRKRFILPIKFSFEKLMLFSKIRYPGRVELLSRISVTKDALIFALKKNKREDIKILEARLEELEWVAYANTKKEKSK